MLDTNYYELLSAAPGNTGLYVGQPGDPRTFGGTGVGYNPLAGNGQPRLNALELLKTPTGDFIGAEMALQMDDRAIALMPDTFFGLIRYSLTRQNLGMHAGDQHFLIIRAVENTNPAAFRQVTGGAPKEIMFLFVGARMSEAEDLATLRVDPGHHMLDCTVFSGRIHRLKNQKNRV